MADGLSRDKIPSADNFYKFYLELYLSPDSEQRNGRKRTINLPVIKYTAAEPIIPFPGYALIGKREVCG